MKKLSVLALLIFSIGATAQTTSTPKQQLIEEMITLTKVDKMMDQMIVQFKEGFSKGFEKSFNDQVTANNDDPAKYQNEMHQFEDKVFATFSDRLSWTKLKPKFIAIYDETFTEKELTDIIAFYKSPSGQSLVQKTPDLMAKGGQIGQSEMAGAIPEIQKMSQDFMESVAKKKP